MADADGTSPDYAPLQDAVYFRPPGVKDLDAVHALEAASYPADEAATRDKLRMRIERCPEAFLLAVSSGSDQIVGFACGTCTAAPTLTHESMGSHDPEGQLLCVHSVVVAPQLRRQGLATRLLQAYLRYVRAMAPQLTEVRLISKQQLVPLYEKAGFLLLGPSDVQHGADPWLELVHRFDAE